MLDGFPSLRTAVKQQVRSFRFSELEIFKGLNLSLSNKSVIETVPNSRIFFQVPCVTNVMSSFHFIADMNDKPIKLIVLVMSVFIGQNFTKVDREFKIEWFLYLFAST
jgi:hypothetical protein